MCQRIWLWSLSFQIMESRHWWGWMKVISYILRAPEVCWPVKEWYNCAWRFPADALCLRWGVLGIWERQSWSMSFELWVYTSH
jgi:hypothetical protein